MLGQVCTHQSHIDSTAEFNPFPFTLTCSILVSLGLEYTSSIGVLVPFFLVLCSREERVRKKNQRRLGKIRLCDEYSAKSHSQVVWL